MTRRRHADHDVTIHARFGKTNYQFETIGHKGMHIGFHVERRLLAGRWHPFPDQGTWAGRIASPVQFG